MNVQPVNQNKNPNQSKLEQIRQFQDLVSKDWETSPAGDGIYAVDPVDGERKLIAQLCSTNPADNQFLAAALSNQKFMVSMLAQSFEAIRELRRNPPKDYAAHAAMQTNKPEFRKFLIAQHGLGNAHSDEQAQQKVRDLCDVKSRSELSRDPQAAERWKDLFKKFRSWERGNR